MSDYSDIQADDVVADIACFDMSALIHMTDEQLQDVIEGAIAITNAAIHERDERKRAEDMDE